ncbi:MAG: single-stranded DNA-binding protein, partial [Planctomycetes bacterium]|nr:single-stranded DNA-binding protein [Planctomycetota bacterium]
MPEKIIRITRRLVRELEPLRFSEPIACVYNPLVYARRAHEQYIRRFARKGVESVLLGINGGPFGMAQTGVPFGEVNHVRDWLKIEEKIDKPPREHPKRPVLGFDCPRSEVSGARL